MRKLILRSFLVAIFLLPIIALSGCKVGFVIGPGSGDDANNQVVRLSAPGMINRPLIGGGDDWTRQPLNRTLFLFGTGTDRYGNTTGLTDDSVWHIKTVTIRCEKKGSDDTIYNPGDAYQLNGFSADGFANACVWYPTYTGEIEGNSGLPYSPAPEAQYPFDACRNLPTTPYPAQHATITAKAKADWVFVKITVPQEDGAIYALEDPGGTPQTSNVFNIYVGKPGDVVIVMEKDGIYKRFTYTVPVEWFWCTGTWTIDVMATGLC